jgi:hypothetical protein
LAAVPVTAGFLSQEPAETAHVQSRLRTEPMRLRLPITSSVEASSPRERSRQSRVTRPSSPLPLGEGLGERDRARRFAWPARGTERFLGRCVSKFPWKERGDNAVGSWERESA